LVGLAPLLALDGVGAAAKRGRGPHEIETGRLPAAVTARGKGARPSVKDRYIVVLKNAVGDPLRVAKQLATDGVVPTHVYRHVFKGFAALIPPGRLAALKRDPNVVSVEPDRIVRLAAEVAGLPTGVDRIDADLNTFAKIDDEDLPRVDVDVAVIDSGVGPHPDLNVYAEANCTTDASANDGYGHGTAVAGVIGALDNGTGVVGVAPGARLWNIKAFDNNGVGEFSWIECGLDTVTAYAPGTGDPLGDIEVANGSFGGPSADPTHTDYPCGAVDNTYHNSFCRAVEAGVTVVVAAGNNAQDAKGFIPAHFDEVITVSALADSDGKPGGTGPATSAGADDTFYRDPAVAVGTNGAGSNFGADIDLAAPGVDIRSTVPTTGGACCSDPSGYKSLPGTSIASPHVAGAAALYIAEHGRAGPAAVKDGLLAQAEHFELGIPGDPDGMAEGVVHVGTPDTTPPEVSIISPTGGARVKKGATIKLFATDTQSGVKSVAVRYCKGTACNFANGKLIGTDTTSPYTVKWGKQPKNGTYTLLAQATDKAGNTKLSDPVTVRVKN